MLIRRVAATSAILLATGALAPALVHADAGATLYVNNNNVVPCSDSGSGTQAAPFCTIQAAANAAVPGDTVSVFPSTIGYRETDITVSGTANAPITFVSGVAAGYANPAGVEGSQHDFTVSGASDIVIEDFNLESSKQDDILINGSSAVTIADNEMLHGGSASAVHVTGASTGVTVSRNRIEGDAGAGVLVDDAGAPGAASSDTVTTNMVVLAGGPAVEVDGVPGTAVTSNTVIEGCGSGIELSAAPSSSVENNVVGGTLVPGGITHCATTASPGAGIDVSADSTAGTTANDNLVFATSALTTVSQSPAYLWGGAVYTSGAALDAVTGQGAADSNNGTDISMTNGELGPASTAIDSANADAPGELSTDLLGNPRVDDTEVANTGVGVSSFYDRGAFEFQDPMINGVSVSVSSLSALQIEAAPGIPLGAFGPVDYTVDFGDGASATGSSGAGIDHDYAKPGAYTVTLTAVDATGITESATDSITTIASDYTPDGPTRILDTRVGTGAAKAKLAAGQSIDLQVTGVGGVPADATAVALNVTATDTTGSGFLGVYPAGDSTPSASSLNYTAAATVANAVIVPIGSSGQVVLQNEGSAAGSVDVIADVSGYFTQTAANGYTPVYPTRILDTRLGEGAAKAKVGAGKDLVLQISTAGTGTAAPSTPITAVALHVTTTDTSGSGYIAAYPNGGSVPNVSSLDYTAGSTVSNTVIVPVSSNGEVDLYNGGESAGPVDLVADMTGFFTTSGTGAYVPVPVPYRILDTRTTSALTAGASDTLVVTGPAQPTTGSGAIAFLLNLTVTEPTAPGFIAAGPGEQYPVVPGTSNVNFVKNQTVANLALVTAGPNGVLFNNGAGSGSAQLIVDVYGYFATS